MANALRGENGRLDHKTVQAKLVALIGYATFRFEAVKRHRSARSILAHIYLIAARTEWVTWKNRVAFVVFFRAVVDARVDMLQSAELMKMLVARNISPSPLYLKIDKLLEVFGGDQGWFNAMDLQWDLWLDILEEDDYVHHLIDGDSECARAPSIVKEEEYDEKNRETQSGKLADKMEGLEV